MKRTLMAYLAIAFAANLAAANGAMISARWSHNSFADMYHGLAGKVWFEGVTEIESGEIVYQYQGGKPGRTQLTSVDDGSRSLSFRIPGDEAASLSTMTFYAEVKTVGGVSRTATREVPVNYVEELDITGNPPVVLTYPLGGDDALVRYIPCCNIFGGTMLTMRVGANPTEFADGLPSKLVTDFVVLEPDGLTTSTAGLHFQYQYDKAGANARGIEEIALYYLKGGVWTEMETYELDGAAGTIDFHCPEGGTFVAGEKGALARDAATE